MATALLSFQLYMEQPITSLNPAKTKKPHNYEPRKTRHISCSTTTSIDRRHIRTSKNAASSVRRLLSCVNSGCLDVALQVFDRMNKSSTFVWNVMIRGLVDSGLFEEAIEMYFRMQYDGIKADNFTFPFVIKACAGVYGLKEGQSVHSIVMKLGLDVDVYICNALIVMYAKVGCVKDSEKVFELMPVRDLVSWNSMVSGYVSAGDGWGSLMYFQEMQKSGVGIDRFSYLSALGACAIEGFLLSGKEILCQVLRNGLELDSMIQSSLIDMFGKCGEVGYAERFFNLISQKNVVVWNAMVGAYALNDKSFESFACLKKMVDDGNVTPDSVTLINLLPSCSKLEFLLQGKANHGFAIRKGYMSHLVLETALVDMYGKCGSINLAKYAFSRMKERNLVSWNVMVAAYVHNSKLREALEMFQKLQHESWVPDELTLVSILAAYSEIALPIEGKQIHCHMAKSGYSLNTFISNAMINMYAKCGDLDSARKVFDGMLFKDLISWNTIIMAYAVHGHGEHSLRLFSEMLIEGNEPDESTFVSLLTACSVAGFLDKGWGYFVSMKRDYGLDPGIEHYGCMLDLLGRFGNLDIAKRFIDEMPLTPTHRIWGSLLTASRHHKNIEMAEIAANQILSLSSDNDNRGCYILLSNMYAEVGRWDDVERVRCLMNKQGLERTTECSIVECNGKTYKFINHDKSQSIKVVYDVLDILSRKIGEDLYFGGASNFKQERILEKRDNSPLRHSVRLAVCFGLISRSVGETVLIRKNVRICEGCHVAIKKISGVTKREIIVGDSKMYHHFKDGRCSCGDYW